MSRLIVISNRVALPQAGRRTTPGGLAVAVNAALKDRLGVWFGWSGEVADPPQTAPRITTTDKVTYGLIDLSTQDYQEYYNGFANRVLWPILHYRVDLAEFSRVELDGYQRVNERFADQVAGLIGPDDLIWVHDYHLMPLAKALRERGHQNRIGFFLHIPCPPPEILETLPRHEDIVRVLSSYDLVGFQTENDRDNFGRYLANHGGLVSRDGTTFDVGGRLVRLGAFPVGIETHSFARLARRAAKSSFVEEVNASLAGRQMVIGVDRLDYSKGILARIDAFGHFLEKFPERRGAVTYLQITPKSRADIPEYAAMDRDVSSAAGRINGQFGEASWTPIRYVNRVYSRTALAGLYRAARVGLVTPLRDGMNLVAKEYVAAQDPDDPGVLVLSRFAGAAAELDGAIIVNPHEMEGVAAAIEQALAMPLDERKARHARMMQILLANDIETWAQRFLAVLADTRSRPRLFDNLRSLLTGT